MPTIACPGCGKKYKLPASAAGQVAKCACGKRFRLAAAPSRAAATSIPTKPKSAPAPKSRPVDPVAATVSDDFWDEALNDTVPVSAPVAAPAKPATNSVGKATATLPGRPVAAAEVPPKKRKKRKGIRWGFDWGKVAGGLLTFLVAGGITVGLVIATDRLFFWPAGIAIVGLFTALSGLMGEEGIW